MGLDFLVQVDEKKKQYPGYLESPPATRPGHLQELSLSFLFKGVYEFDASITYMEIGRNLKANPDGRATHPFLIMAQRNTV